MTTYEIAVLFVNLVIPTVSQNILALLSYLTTLYYVSLLNDAVLTASFGLATTFCHILGLSLFVGVNCA